LKNIYIQVSIYFSIIKQRLKVLVSYRELIKAGMYRPPPRPEPKNPFFAIFASIGIFAGIFIFIYLIGQCVEKIQEYLNKKPESSSSTASNSEGKGVDSRVKKDQ